MSDIKPYADGSCNPDCQSYMDVTLGISTVPVCQAVPGMNVQTGEMWHCVPAYKRLQAVVDAAREAVEEWQEFRDHEAEMSVLFEKLRALDGEP